MTPNPEQLRAAFEHALAAADLDDTAPAALGEPLLRPLVLDQHRRRALAARRRPALVAAIVVVVAGLVGGGGVFLTLRNDAPAGVTTQKGAAAQPPPTGPTGVEDENETITPAPGVTTRPMPGVTITKLDRNSDLARTVSTLLPGEPPIRSATRTRSEDGMVDSIRLSTVADGVGYEVTVYKHFDESEKADAQIPRLEVPGAQAWGGAYMKDRTGVTYLAQDQKFAIQVASLTTGATAPDSVETVLSIARSAAENPVVIDAAKPG